MVYSSIMDSIQF